MSTSSQATVFRITEVLPHPNAERLEIVKFFVSPEYLAL